MKYLNDSIIRIILPVATLVGGFFLMSIFTDFFLPGTLSHRITTIAYAVTAALLLPTGAAALGGYLWLVWRKANDSRFFIELPRSSGPQFVARVPTAEQVTLLTFGSDSVAGVEIGSNGRSASVQVAPRTNRAGTGLLYPTPNDDEALVDIFFNRHPGGS